LANIVTGGTEYDCQPTLDANSACVGGATHDTEEGAQPLQHAIGESWEMG